MTVLIPTMCLPVCEQAPESNVKAFPLPESSPGSDTEACRIAAGVARGEDGAFRELYDRYQNRLLRLALVLSRGDEALAHETVQSVFLTAASKLRRVESEAHLWNWLGRVARQQIGKAWRQRGRDSAVVSVAELPEWPAAGESDSELEEKLDAALLAAGAEDRQLIEWFYFDGLSHKEIAARLRATSKAVSSRLERARARLKSLLAHSACHEADGKDLR
jgi:RNA polymerase sigma-70 factor (ECF subfamily)